MSDIEERAEQKGMTRRAFLGHAAVGAAAVTVGSSIVGAPSALAASAQSTSVPKKWHKTYDVVVIGTGVGLAAAIEAKRAGASVVILEAADHIGGLYITAGGSFSMGGNNVVQQAAGVVDNDEQWFQDEMYCTGYRAQPELVRTLVKHGAETVKWFQDLGIKYAPIANGVLYGRTPIMRGITALQDPAYPGGQGTPNTGISFTMVMYNEVKRLKIPVLMNTRMTKIFRGSDGVVPGVQARDKKGKVLNIRGKRGVVICAGTWTDNDQMMQQWDPRLVGPDCYGDGGTPFDGTLFTDSAGDGIRFAQDIGAAVSDMSFAAYLYIFYGGRSYWGWAPGPDGKIDWTSNATYAAGKAIPQSAATFQNTILVANNGKRYVNESTRFDPVPGGRGAYSENPEMPYTDAYLSLPQPRNVWMIADSATAAALSWPIGEPTDSEPSTITHPDPLRGKMFDPACIAIADSIEELAAKTGVDAANLQETIDRYNGFVDAGVDDDFGKPNPRGKIETAPFYGLKASLIRHTQRNGLRCNTKMQVIEDKVGYKAVSSIDKLKTIPNLYVAGESGNIFGWKRTHNTLAHYITAAIIAGRNCAKRTPPVK